MKKLVEIVNGGCSELTALVRTKKDGTYMVEITKPRKDRSSNQNRTWYDWLNTIEAETGTHIEELKRHLMQKLGFGEWNTIKVKRMVLIATNAGSHQAERIIEKKTFKRQSSVELSKPDFAKLMEATHQLAAWNEIILRMPGEV
jgi:hypothetical protein